MSVLNNLSKRLKSSNSQQHEYNSELNSMQKRLRVRGGLDQWTRMREDKLRSLKKALLYSYQSAIVQKFNVKNANLIQSINNIINKLLQDQILTDDDNILLNFLQEEYDFLDRQHQTTQQYISSLNSIIDIINNSQPFFRCLINHDKLKVDYQDKIISIPFQQIPVDGTEVIQTNFHNGTVFKWVHGNKEEWTPDTYWIVYMQYSQETAYFRAEIRKADEQIQIIVIDDQGDESTVKYRGWMTGPNETTAMWTTKKNITWNDMNYTKLLYITKDENTLAFFQRFDRIIINGKPWEVQAYNQNYSVSKTGEDISGIIRVALKETYTGTDQFVKQTLEKIQNNSQQEENEQEESYIEGPIKVKPFSILKYKAKNFDTESKNWDLYGTSLAKIVSVSADSTQATIEILTGFSNKKGFYINYGDSDDTKIHVTIESL